MATKTTWLSFPLFLSLSLSVFLCLSFYICAVECLLLSQLKGLFTALNEYQIPEALYHELISSNGLYNKIQSCLGSFVRTTFNLQKKTVCWRYTDLNLLSYKLPFSIEFNLPAFSYSGFKHLTVMISNFESLSHSSSIHPEECWLHVNIAVYGTLIPKRSVFLVSEMLVIGQGCKSYKIVKFWSSDNFFMHLKCQ